LRNGVLSCARNGKTKSTLCQRGDEEGWGKGAGFISRAWSKVGYGRVQNDHNWGGEGKGGDDRLRRDKAEKRVHKLSLDSNNRVMKKD